jgi:ABC-type Fe3+ transport system permease subunit
MAMEKLKSQQVVMRILTPLAILAVSKVMETKTVRAALEEVDARALVTKRNVTRAIERRARNAADNTLWIAAGAAAIALGIGLMVTATRK